MDEDSYEDLTECGLSQELEDKLLYSVRNCVFMWTNAKGEPFGVVMSYLPKDGKLWLTAAERRKRIPALRRFPRASICISGAGTPLGSGRTVTYKGSVVIHDDRETADRETRDWFYPGSPRSCAPAVPAHRWDRPSTRWSHTLRRHCRA